MGAGFEALCLEIARDASTTGGNLSVFRTSQWTAVE